jgi:hypothetical protein
MIMAGNNMGQIPENLMIYEQVVPFGRSLLEETEQDPVNDLFGNKKEEPESSPALSE